VLRIINNLVIFGIRIQKMATIETIYQSDLRTQATHVYSGNKIITDAPLDNQGKAEAFSPTDLMSASLGSCMFTIMGIAAREHGIDIDGSSCSITKVMAADPRRVSEIQITFNFPDIIYTEKQRVVLERSARNCPVAKSLHPDLIQNIVFNFKD
jgi:putative redox protein